jgi:hypothetical protein
MFSKLINAMNKLNIEFFSNKFLVEYYIINYNYVLLLWSEGRTK